MELWKEYFSQKKQCPSLYLRNHGMHVARIVSGLIPIRTLPGLGMRIGGSHSDDLPLSVSMCSILIMSVSPPGGQLSTSCSSSGESMPMARTWVIVKDVGRDWGIYTQCRGQLCCSITL